MNIDQCCLAIPIWVRTCLQNQSHVENIWAPLIRYLHVLFSTFTLKPPVRSVPRVPLYVTGSRSHDRSSVSISQATSPGSEHKIKSGLRYSITQDLSSAQCIRVKIVNASYNLESTNAVWDWVKNPPLYQPESRSMVNRGQEHTKIAYTPGKDDYYHVITHCRQICTSYLMPGVMCEGLLRPCDNPVQNLDLSVEPKNVRRCTKSHANQDTEVRTAIPHAANQSIRFSNPKNE